MAKTIGNIKVKDTTITEVKLKDGTVLFKDETVNFRATYYSAKSIKCEVLSFTSGIKSVSGKWGVGANAAQALQMATSSSAYNLGESKPGYYFIGVSFTVVFKDGAKGTYSTTYMLGSNAFTTIDFKRSVKEVRNIKVL